MSFSSQLLNDVFINESTILDNLLINCNCIATMTGYAFTIKREYYCQILFALYQIKKTHSDLVLAEGYPVPELPLWGKKGDITEFHLENKYEILAVCFRAEVEEFLITFDKHYNFLTKTLRSTDLVVTVLYPPWVIPCGIHGRGDGIHGMGDGIHTFGGWNPYFWWMDSILLVDGFHTFSRWIPYLFQLDSIPFPDGFHTISIWNPA